MTNQLKAIAAQMNMSDIQDMVHTCIAKAEAHYKVVFISPSIDFSVRGVVAGLAYSGRNHIAINRTLYSENPQGMLAQTVPHEVAHLIAHQLYGQRNIKSHGQEWKSIMRVLGANPKTCHTYDVTNSRQWKQRRFTYVCGCQEHKLTTTRHNKLLRNRAKYTCRRCRQALVRKGTPKANLVQGLLKDVRAAAEKLHAPKDTTTKSWNPKAGSKGALALDIYKDILWMDDAQIVKYLMKKMSIKLANARAYLAKCKTA